MTPAVDAAPRPSDTEDDVRRGRLPWYHPDELDEAQRELYDAVVSGPRSHNRRTPLTDAQGRILGPHNAMLSHPALGNALQEIGAGLRFGGTLPRRLFEVLVLVTAVERDAPYEWYAHAPIARSHGVSDEELEALRQGRDPEVDADEAAALALARACLDHTDPGDALVQRVVDAYGREGVTEIVTTVGLYDLIGTLMRVWDHPLPDGVEDPLRHPVTHEG